MVPEGWQRKPIGDVCAAIVDCVNKTAPVVDEPTPYKMIRTTNVRHGRVDTDSVRYVAEKTFRIWTRRGELQDGDIILTREAPVGEVGQLRNADGMFLGQRTMVYRADGELMDQQFLYQTMIGPSLVRQYHADSAGGTVAHIRVPDCSKFVLMVPPLPEQRKIADILSTWDQAIEKTEALLSNARTQKRALMQQLLTGKRRFPAFEGQPWKEVRLGDVAKIITGSTPATQTLEYYGGPVPFVSPADLQGQNNLTTAAKTLTVEGASVSRLVPKDAILFSCIGHIGKIAKSGVDVVTNQQINSVVPNADVDPDFLFYELQHRAPRVALLAGHNVIPIINKSEFSLTKVHLPSLAEQSCIAEVLNNQNAVIEELSEQLDKLRTEKKALMQQLLTGKRRVAV